jgi:hypothetical protein
MPIIENNIQLFSVKRINTSQETENNCNTGYEFYPCGVHPVALCTRVSFKYIPAITTENLLVLFFS